jgi:hypothetical protein
MMTLEQAITNYIEARTEAEHWQGICSDWMKAHGRRHSYTYTLLVHRRLSRHCLRIARCELADTLENWCPFEVIMDEERNNPDVPTSRRNILQTAQHLADLARLVLQ